MSVNTNAAGSEPESGLGLLGSAITRGGSRFNRSDNARIVILASILSLALQFTLVFTTVGSDDIKIFAVWAGRVAEYGPVGIYHHLPLMDGPLPFNHPPLAAWWLWILEKVSRGGYISFGAMLRIPLVLSNAVTTYVVYQILSRRVSRPAVLLGSLVTALSPILMLVAGYHGNNDPWAVSLVLLGAWLLADRDMPILAGLAVAAGLGLKLPPAVAVPAVIIAAMALGRRSFLRFFAGFLAGSAVIWGPALAVGLHGVLHSIIGYNGAGFPHMWGLYEIAVQVHAPAWVLKDFAGSGGRDLVLAASALPAAWIAWRRPDLTAQSMGLALCVFLVLSPEFSVQYLAWIAAGALLLDLTWGLAVNTAAGVFLANLYLRWARHEPWSKSTVPVTHLDIELALVTWAVLASTAFVGGRRLLAAARSGAAPRRPVPAPQTAGDPGPGLEPDAPAATPMKVLPEPARPVVPEH